MKSPYLFIAIVLAVIGGIVWYIQPSDAGDEPNQVMEDPSNTPDGEGREWEPVAVIAADLDIPWDLTFLPAQAGLPGAGDMLVTERGGRLLRIDMEGGVQEIAVEDIAHRGEGGLLGVAPHPDFENNQFVYLYMTAEGSGGGLENRVVRYSFGGNTLEEDRVIIEGIPGAQYHDGGRIAFGPDGHLYITTGDAGTPRLAQDRDSLAGKILRLADDGTIPTDNPFASTGSAQAAVYSYGHRNPQGLAWDADGQLWSTEHGPTSRDEVNAIEAGENYGWPGSVGDDVVSGTIPPVLHSGAGTTWAPASAAILGNSLFFGGLRGSALYEAVLLDGEVAELREHFKGEFGRIRTVEVGPDNALYLTTSNHDGRGSPRSNDDRVIRIDPATL